MIKNVKLPQFDKNEIFSRGDFLASGTVFLKKHLKNKVNTHKLFDSKTFTNDLEKIYTKILYQ